MQRSLIVICISIALDAVGIERIFPILPPPPKNITRVDRVASSASRLLFVQTCRLSRMPTPPVPRPREQWYWAQTA